MASSSQWSGATQNAELVSECLATLLELAPQLAADERAYVAAQHPFATDGWLEAILAVSAGDLPPDANLIADLEQQVGELEEQEKMLYEALDQAELRAQTLEANAAVLLKPAPMAAQRQRQPMNRPPQPPKGRAPSPSPREQRGRPPSPSPRSSNQSPRSNASSQRGSARGSGRSSSKGRDRGAKGARYTAECSSAGA